MILSFTQLRSEWIVAGGSPKEADTAAAVAMAESHGRMGASNLQDPYGGSWGPWEINGVHPFLPSALTSDPYYSAIAAVYVHHKSGWRAWSTYRYGQYKAFLPHHARHANAHRMLQVKHGKVTIEKRTLHRGNHHTHVTHHPAPATDLAPMEALNYTAICFTLACALFALWRLWLHVFKLWGVAIREEVALQKRAIKRRRYRDEAALRKRTMPRTQRRLVLTAN